MAKAAFEALKAADLGPLEAYLITPEEARKMTGVALNDATERDRQRDLVAQHHERLSVDWDSATMTVGKVKFGPMGSDAIAPLSIRSDRGTVLVEVMVRKAGSRYVFDGLKPVAGAEPKQPAPDSEDDGG